MEIEVDAVDGADERPVRAVVDANPTGGQGGPGHRVASSRGGSSTRPPDRCRSTGLKISLSPSPTSVRPVTSKTIAIPGNNDVHQIPDDASGIARCSSYPHS